jgi:hypothetical protein
VEQNSESKLKYEKAKEQILELQNLLSSKENELRIFEENYLSLKNAIVQDNEKLIEYQRNASLFDEKVEKHTIYIYLMEKNLI